MSFRALAGRSRTTHPAGVRHPVVHKVQGQEPRIITRAYRLTLLPLLLDSIAACLGPVHARPEARHAG